MRLFALVGIVLSVTACNNSASNKADTKDTAKSSVQMPEPPATADTVFTGFGTEPFWSVYVIKDSKIVFHPADGPDLEVPYVNVVTENNTSRYQSAAGEISMDLQIEKKNCSDGMSDDTHPFQVVLQVNKTKYSGCGREGK